MDRVIDWAMARDWDLTCQWCGAFAFGTVVGWIAGNVIVEEKIGVSQFGALVGILIGAAITRQFQDGLFGAYCIGLAVMFFFNVLLKDKVIATLPSRKQSPRP